MMQDIVYTPMFDGNEKNVVGWDKETIDYVVRNKSKVCSQIRKIAKAKLKRNFQYFKVDEVYSDLLLYCYQYDDYDINKAIERSSTSEIVSIEGYVYSCIKFCVARYVSDEYKVNADIAEDPYVNTDDEHLSLLDVVYNTEDNISIDDLVYDIREICESCESVRYRFGIDIYLVWYIRLITMLAEQHKIGKYSTIASKKRHKESIDHSIYTDILSVIGIDKKDIISMDLRAKEDEVMLSFAKAISIEGAESSLPILENYVFAHEIIKDAVKCCVGCCDEELQSLGLNVN